MKQLVWIVLLFVVTLGVALWALKAFDTDKPAVAPSETPATPPPAPSTDLSASPDAEPRDEPTPEIPPFAEPVRVLLLGDAHRSFTAWLELNWDFLPAAIRWQAWYATPAPEGAKTHSEGLPALSAPPAAPDLETIQVLVLAGLDPKSLPADFWARVADRVKSGALGLLVVTENRFAHATATEPSLATVLPVTGSKPVVPAVTGGDLPGVYKSAVSLRATEAGTKHAATRLVSWPKWSRTMWDQQASAQSDGRWETKFCAAVAGPAADATVLVEAQAGPTSPAAVVASDAPNRRVLWVSGFFDVTDGAYRGSKSGERFRALCISWIAWLSGERV